MNQKTIPGIALVLLLTASSLGACTEPSTPEDDGATGGTGGASGGTGGVSSGGTAGSSTGGSSTGGSSTGGTSTGGTSTGGSAGSGPAGGSSNGGTGGEVGGSGGNPIGGTGGDGGLGGTSTGGTDMGGAGGSAGGTSGPVTVQLGVTKQKIDGFGINNTWAQAMTDGDADAMFSTTNGIGLSILRVGLGPDGNPMSANIPADITKARGAQRDYIIGSCWSPPANCKTNNNVNDGGHVKPSCYESWSTTIANFANSNDLYAMSIAERARFCVVRHGPSRATATTRRRSTPPTSTWLSSRWQDRSSSG